MKKIVWLFGSLVSWSLFGQSLVISNVTVRQRYPWNGKVDIAYSVSGDVASYCQNHGLIPILKVMATDKDTNKTYAATKLSGDMNLTDGAHELVWDLDAQGLTINSADVVFNISCEAVEATYCVIDLSAGANATNYPVSYLTSEPSGGFNVDEYKTTKLVLKRITPGSFVMGDNQADLSHVVTLTKPVYMGIFEVTQKQWVLVMGSNPSTSYGVGDVHPVHSISYDMIRGSTEGAKWPASAKVDDTSFLGKLQERTRLNFDLPTDAQWEYACRAGTTTRYYWGAAMNGDYAWNPSNSSSVSHPVGGKQPNAWGFYDMSGNVWEWNLDWFGTLAYGTDPKGSPSGSSRVLRGGSWHITDSWSSSSYRHNRAPSYTIDDYGFRLSRTLP